MLSLTETSVPTNAMSNGTLDIKAMESGPKRCYGLGEVNGEAVSWLCGGHSDIRLCTAAWVMTATEGDHFVDEKSGACFAVKEAKVISCDRRCVGTWDVETWPSPTVNTGTVPIGDRGSPSKHHPTDLPH